jgi:hypothetical protein
MDRDALEREYLRLLKDVLPARAKAEAGWPVRFDHCFMVRQEVAGKEFINKMTE